MNVPPFLALAVLAGIAYGSLYPFDFRAAHLNEASLAEFLTVWPLLASRSDAIANLLLFIPFGFVGMGWLRHRSAPAIRLVLVLVAAAVFATALQVAQFYLPSRTPTLGDVLWNVVSSLLGAIAGLALWSLHHPSRRGSWRWPPIPLLLLGSWIAVRLFPFMPSLDLQVIKASLKPLLLYPEVTGMGLFSNAVSWWVAALLVRRLRWRRRAAFTLGVLIAGVFVLEVVIVDNDVTASNVLGALLAWTVALAVPGAGSRIAASLAVLLGIAILAQGLDPFELRAAPARFAWLPFHGFLGGSSYVNALAILYKTFLYGSLVYLLRISGWFWPTAGTVTALGLAVIEVAQIFFTGHAPETTDPLLAIFLAMVFSALDRQRPETGLLRRPVLASGTPTERLPG